MLKTFLSHYYLSKLSEEGKSNQTDGNHVTTTSLVRLLTGNMSNAKHLGFDDDTPHARSPISITVDSSRGQYTITLPTNVFHWELLSKVCERHGMLSVGMMPGEKRSVEMITDKLPDGWIRIEHSGDKVTNASFVNGNHQIDLSKCTKLTLHPYDCSSLVGKYIEHYWISGSEHGVEAKKVVSHTAGELFCDDGEHYHLSNPAISPIGIASKRKGVDGVFLPSGRKVIWQIFLTEENATGGLPCDFLGDVPFYLSAATVEEWNSIIEILGHTDFQCFTIGQLKDALGKIDISKLHDYTCQFRCVIKYQLKRMFGSYLRGLLYWMIDDDGSGYLSPFLSEYRNRFTAPKFASVGGLTLKKLICRLIALLFDVSHGWNASPDVENELLARSLPTTFSSEVGTLSFFSIFLVLEKYIAEETVECDVDGGDLFSELFDIYYQIKGVEIGHDKRESYLERKKIYNFIMEHIEPHLLRNPTTTLGKFLCSKMTREKDLSDPSTRKDFLYGIFASDVNTAREFRRVYPDCFTIDSIIDDECVFVRSAKASILMGESRDFDTRGERIDKAVINFENSDQNISQCKVAQDLLAYHGVSVNQIMSPSGIEKKQLLEKSHGDGYMYSDLLHMVGSNAETTFLRIFDCLHINTKPPHRNLVSYLIECISLSEKLLKYLREHTKPAWVDDFTDFFFEDKIPDSKEIASLKPKEDDGRHTILTKYNTNKPVQNGNVFELNMDVEDSIFYRLMLRLREMYGPLFVDAKQRADQLASQIHINSDDDTFRVPSMLLKHNKSSEVFEMVGEYTLYGLYYCIFPPEDVSDFRSPVAVRDTFNTETLYSLPTGNHALETATKERANRLNLALGYYISKFRRTTVVPAVLEYFIKLNELYTFLYSNDSPSPPHLQPTGFQMEDLEGYGWSEHVKHVFTSTDISHVNMAMLSVSDAMQFYYLYSGDNLENKNLKKWSDAVLEYVVRFLQSWQNDNKFEEFKQEKKRLQTQRKGQYIPKDMYDTEECEDDADWETRLKKEFREHRKEAEEAKLKEELHEKQEKEDAELQAAIEKSFEQSAAKTDGNQNSEDKPKEADEDEECKDDDWEAKLKEELREKKKERNDAELQAAIEKSLELPATDGNQNSENKPKEAGEDEECKDDDWEAKLKEELREKKEKERSDAELQDAANGNQNSEDKPKDTDEDEECKDDDWEAKLKEELPAG